MKVLVVEDDETTRQLLAGVLRQWGYEVTAVRDGEEAWDALKRKDTRLVITDWEMPRLNGPGLCKRIRSEIGQPYTFVLMLTNHPYTDHVVSGLRSGADDFIQKPFKPLELQARLEVGSRILALQDDLLEKNLALERLTQTDEHTGLFNARRLRAQLDDELKRCTRFHRPLSLLFLDLDHFKRVNDSRGHLVGSATLKHAGKLLADCTRIVDSAFRYGGDEFALLLIETGPDGAVHVANRVLEAFRSQTFDVGGGPPLALTISIGVACVPDHAKLPKELLEAADAAMYKAKAAGRNAAALASTPNSTA